jgi:D-3-phosphoglycerate dehydrogenase
MTLLKVLALGHRFESLSPEQEVLAGLADVIDGNALTAEEREGVLSNVSAIMLGTRAELDAARIDMAGNCRVIVRYGVGVDNVDVAAAARRGIAVANVPDYCVEEVSDHALALLLAANRRLIDAALSARNGVWGTGMMKGTERLSTQTVGIVGFGRIAQAFAHKVKALVDRVIAYDPWVSPYDMSTQAVEAVTLGELLHDSDYVSIHCPLTIETRHLFNETTLNQMKPSAWLVNTARGEIIDEAALAWAVENHLIGGAALDVLGQEPPAPDFRLLSLSNIIITPHVGYYSQRAIEDLQRGAALQVREVLTGGSPKWHVNPPDRPALADSL